MCRRFAGTHCSETGSEERPCGRGSGPQSLSTDDGGILSTASMATNSEGYAWTNWTLGQSPGQQTVTATVRAYPNLEATFTATAVTPQTPTLRFTVQPSSATEGATITPPALVTAYDEFGAVDTDFTGNVAIAIATNPGNGGLSGTRFVDAVAGVAAFSDLSIDAAGAGYTLEAAATGYLTATSNAFTITDSGQGDQVAWINANGGDWSNGSNWSTGSPPTATDTAVIVLPGTYMVTLDADATVGVLVLGDGSNEQGLTISGTTLTVNTSLIVAYMAVLWVDGNIAGDGLITVNGIMSWTSGTIAGNALVWIGVDGNMTVSDTPTKTLDQRQIRNDGLLEWTRGDIVLANNAVIDNDGTGYFEASPNASISGSGMLANSGTFRQVTADSTRIQVPFSNDGITDIASGYLVLESDLYHAPGAMIQGAGTLDLNGATVAQFEGDIGPGASPGVLTVEGDLTLGASSTVFVEINGTTAGTEYDHLNVVGNLVVAGTLDITMGFTPSLGNSFNVLDFVTVSGSFTTINGLNIGNGMQLDPIWETNTLALDVVSATPAGTISWTGAGDGSNWSDPTNWNLGRIPNTTDTVTITLDGIYTVDVDATTTVYALEVGGTTGTQTLSIGAGQTLTVDSAATIGSMGALSMISGTLDGSGTLTAVSGASVVIENSTIETQVSNNSSLVALGATTNINGTYVSGPGSVLRVEGTFPSNSTLTIANGFVNNGVIELTSSSISRSSRLNVTNGTLVNAAGGVLDCLLGANSTVCYMDAELDNQGSMTIARMLRMNMNGAAHSNSGTITLTGGAGWELDMTPGSFVNSGTIDASAGSIVIDQFTASSFTNSGTVTVGSPYEFRINDGAVNVPSGGSFTGDGLVRFNRVLATIDAAIDNTTTEFASNSITVSGTGSITNAVGRTMTLTTSTIGIPFTNNGTLVTVNATTFGGPFTNTGTTEVQTGPLTFADDFTHADGAMLQGAGTVDYTAANVLGWDGDVGPGGSGASGILNFVGSGVPSALSEANIEIGGLTAGSGHDQVTVTESFLANGTANVSIINGFTPQLGQTFTVLTFADRTGEFSDTTGLSIAGGLAFDLVWNATSLDLEVVDASPASPGDIVFFSDSGSGLDLGVFTNTSDGSSLNRVAGTGIPTSYAIYPRWSIDRQQISFSNDTSGMNALYMMTSTGADLTQVVNDINSTGSAWSRNGQHLGFGCQVLGGPDNICAIANVTGPISGIPTNTYSTTTGSLPAPWTIGSGAGFWDPRPASQDRIIFAGDSTGLATVSRFFSVSYDGTGLNTIPPTPSLLQVGGGPPLEVLELDISADGTLIVFVGYDAQALEDRLYVMNIDGTGLRQLTFPTGAVYDERPTFSPDGTEVLFGRRDGLCELTYWIVDINNTDGSLERQIAGDSMSCEMDPYDQIGMDWSPDGSQIVLVGIDETYGVWRIYVVPSTVTPATYQTVRVRVGRDFDPGSWIFEGQPSWRP